MSKKRIIAVTGPMVFFEINKMRTNETGNRIKIPSRIETDTYVDFALSIKSFNAVVEILILYN